MTTTPGREAVAAAGKPRCVVALDLRRRSGVGAVAVDGKGRLRAWASIPDGDDPPELARRALEALGVNVRELRVLIGSRTAQVAAWEGDREPDAGLVSEALVAEGHEPIVAPAVATAAGGRGAWLVAAGDEERARSLVAALSELVALEPTLVVDRLLLLQLLQPWGTAAESADDELLVVARPSEGAPLTRAVAAQGAEQAPEVLQTLAAAGGSGYLWLLGSGRGDLRQALEAEAPSLRQEELPVCRGQRLPAGLELAWRLATAAEPPALSSPLLDGRRRSLRWSRRVAMLAVALVALSAVLVALITVASLRLRGRQAANREGLAAMEAQIQKLSEARALAEEVERIRGELAPRYLAWPELAEPLAGLARQTPPGVAWERLTVTEGQLELELSAVGATAPLDLEQARAAFERTAGVGNLSWDEAVPSEWGSGSGLEQVIRATLATAPPGAREVR